MNQYKLPFTVESEEQNFVLSKDYASEIESYKLIIPQAEAPQQIILKFRGSEEAREFKLKVIVEENAECTLIEDWDLELQSKELSYNSKAICKSNSRLRHIVINHAYKKAKLNIKRKTEVEESAECHLFECHFGASELNSEILQETKGISAKIHTDIVLRAKETQSYKINAEHKYSAKNGFGEIEMKNIAEDKAMLDIKGMVRITEKGGGTSGYLNQETLNLSEETVIKALPGLKIDTNDVKAGHGSSIRNLNDEDLFYFNARGISKEEAKKLMITGFIGSELEKIKDIAFAYETIKNLL